MFKSVCTACALLAVSCHLSGQVLGSFPAFEVASVKPADSTRSQSIGRAADRLTTMNTSLRQLITWAYNISDDRLLEQPTWLGSARYDIVAKASTADLPPGRMQQMMQALLAERFKLAAHREMRDGAMYVLVVDRTGPKVSVTKSIGAVAQSPFKMDRSGHLTGASVTPAMLATVLSDQLGRFVKDGTGLDGVFDFTLDWTPDAAQEPTGAGAPSIFTAVQEQLGFRLESRRGPVEALVIDHIERTPTPD